MVFRCFLVRNIGSFPQNQARARARTEVRTSIANHEITAACTYTTHLPNERRSLSRIAKVFSLSLSRERAVREAERVKFARQNPDGECSRWVVDPGWRPVMFFIKNGVSVFFRFRFFLVIGIFFKYDGLSRSRVTSGKPQQILW